MSFGDCISRIIRDPELGDPKGRLKHVLQLWEELVRKHEVNGRLRHVAEVMAAADVKEAVQRQVAEQRHVAIAQIEAARRGQALVTATPQPGTLMSDALEFSANSPNYAASVIGVQRGLVRLFHKRLEGVVRKHSRTLLGRTRNPAGLRNVVAELHGESTGDVAAFAVADAVRTAFEDMRLMFNEAGGVIGKLENWGVPHTHDAAAIRRAGFDAWAAEVAPRLAWDRIPDSFSGRPLATEGELPSAEVQRQFLRAAWDNIAFGRHSAEGGNALGPGQPLWRRRAQERVLPFRTADDWIAYNQAFGTGDPFASIIGHAHRMARDIALAREFGPDPRAGFKTREAQLLQRARRDGDADLARKIEGSAAHAERMLNIMSGSLVPAGRFGENFARFMSSGRHVLTAAFLDRAIISALSDLNSIRMAAKAVGGNPTGTFNRQFQLLFSSMSRDEAARVGWIADTLADPGAPLSRFQADVPPAAVAERLSSAVMRVQGLSHWTDQARIAFQMEMSGLFAANAGRAIHQIEEPLRGLLLSKRITDAEWQAFTDPTTMFRATNGAVFASPIYWREATTLPRREADDLFMRLQAIIEEQTEFAVPTSSTWARAFVEGRLEPGTFGYELLKSGMMFKSFPMTFTVNQVRRIMSLPTGTSRAAYFVDLAAGATVMGAISLQLAEIATGNDPRDMSTPEFWAGAALRGGAFGMIGDTAAAFQSPFGGLPGYTAGPGISLMNDVARLVTSRSEFPTEAVKFGNRYLPGGDVPGIGLALDRLLFDRLVLLLDPESVNAMHEAALRRAHRGASQGPWLPGEALPSRLPDLKAAFGG